MKDQNKIIIPDPVRLSFLSVSVPRDADLTKGRSELYHVCWQSWKGTLHTLICRSSDSWNSERAKIWWGAFHIKLTQVKGYFREQCTTFLGDPVMAKFGKLARLALPFKADLTETQDTMQPQGPDLCWAINSGGKSFEKARHRGCVWSPRLAIENTASESVIPREESEENSSTTTYLIKLKQQLCQALFKVLYKHCFL